jgi:lactam utilization protein B
LRAPKASTINVSLSILDISLAVVAVDARWRILTRTAVVAVADDAVRGVHTGFTDIAFFGRGHAPVNAALINVFQPVEE